jgi:hypothetical protein
MALDLATEARDDIDKLGTQVTPGSEARNRAEQTPDQARELTNRIRDRLDGFVADLLTAWNGRADKVLGYTNWNAYVVSEFGQGDAAMESRDIRRRLGARLREIGMPTRAIGSALGVHHRTVERDLVTTGASAPDGRVLSLDGPSRPASRGSCRPGCHRRRCSLLHKLAITTRDLADRDLRGSDGAL